jgi:dTDP-4-dehydrorhamnose reductase
MTRILLIGNDGQVGYELQRTLAPLGAVTATCYPAVDFASPESIRRAVREATPDWIVNAAAYTAVDKAEAEPDACRALNATAPALLADECRRLGAGLVHYSTDFVFDGTATRPYTEADTPTPLSVYGQTKWEGDQAIMAAGIPHLIFRISWVYGLRGKNFLLTLRRLATEGRPLRVVSDQVGCPTWCRTVAETTAEALRQALSPGRDPREWTGLYHAVSSGSTSWHGFARAFLPPELPVTPIASRDYPTPARRPAYSVLDCSKLERAFGIRMPSWQDALRACMQG